MKHLILILTLLLPATSLAHNILYLDADGIGSNNTVTWIATEAHSESASSGAYFDLGTGSGNTITVDMEGDNNGCCNYIVGGFNSNSNSTLDISFDGTGAGHRVELDYDYSGLSNYHHMSVEISENYSSNRLYFDDGDVDHSNTSFDLEIKGGGSNLVYATLAGTQQAVKLDINGASNTVSTWTSGTGDLATGRTEMYSGDADTYALWILITGSSNTIRAKSVDTSKTKITLSGTGNHTISEYNDNDDWLLNQDGGIIDLTIAGTSNNRIGYSGSGSGNTATITLNGNGQTSLTVDLEQTGGGNRFELEVTGTTIHNYQPKFTQNGSLSYCATVNLNNLASSNSTTTTNASGGC